LKLLNFVSTTNSKVFEELVDHSKNQLLLILDSILLPQLRSLLPEVVDVVVDRFEEVRRILLDLVAGSKRNDRLGMCRKF